MAGKGISRREIVTDAGWAALLTAGAGIAPAAASSAQPSANTASPRDYGAVGDGQYRPLAERFATLSAAQKVFPFVTSLRQSLDWAGIQAALDFVEPSWGRVLIPVGRYILSDSLRMPSQVTLEGEARCGCILDNQNYPLAAPQIVNKDHSAFIYATIRNLTCNGGTHAIAIDVSREVAGLVIEGLTANLQTVANLEFASLETTVFRDCHLIGGKHGISVRNFPCNSVHLVNVRLGEHTDASLRLRGADLVVMFGGSMEAGAKTAPATIDIETGGTYANAIAFRHVYFENTHPTLLRCRGTSGVSFDGCKFTGTLVGDGPGFKPYKFDCGDDLIEFGSNHWDLPTVGPANVLLTGRNDRLQATGTLWLGHSDEMTALQSRARPVGDASSILKLSWAGPRSAPGASWWAANVIVRVAGRAADRTTIREAAFVITIDPERSSAVNVERKSSPGDDLTNRFSLTLALVPDKREAIIGAQALAGEGFTPETVQLILEQLAVSMTPMHVDILPL